MDYSKPISIQNVNGNVTVTIVEGNNNKTELNIDAFTKRFAQDCGLHLIYEDKFRQNSNTSTNFKDWLNGYPFNLRSIYHKREYRREIIINNIKEKLEENQRLLILGESGTSKSIFLMEVLCEYLKKGYKILHNLESGNKESSSSEIKNLEFIEDTLLTLVESGEKILVVVDNVHNKTISNIFYVIKKIRDDHEDILDKLRFLLSARQPEFGLALDRGIFDSETKININMVFDKDKRLFDIDKEKRSKLYFSEAEVKGFIEKYKEHLHPSKRNKSVEENAQEIFKDTQGHPIMVRFSVLQNGLENHVIQMYTDYLLENNVPNTGRIKSVIACSLYDISSIPLTEDELYNKLALEDPSLQIINTMIKRIDNVWTTIHPRWDLELFKYMFSLNEADQRNIQKAFGSILTKILDIESGSFNQLLILNTLYNTIAADQFVDFQIIRELIKEDDIEKKLDAPFFKVIFFANILGVAYAKLKDNEYAIVCFDKAIKVKSQNIVDYIDKGYSLVYYNKGTALSELGRKEEAIASYDKAIDIDPQNPLAYYNKGNALSDLGKKEEAIDCYDNVIRIYPQDSLAYYNKGTALSDLGKKEEAIDCYDNVIRINPQNTDAYYNKGNALLALGRYKEAIDCYDKALDIDPQYVNAYNNKGNALSALGKYKEAIDCYDKALDINPQNADAYGNKGNVLSDLGMKEEAIDCYDNVIRIYPQDSLAYYNKGNVLSDLGMKEEAIDCYDNVIRINPQNADAYYNKGTALSALGKKEEAIECYDKVIEADPQNADAYNNKGSALSDLGRDEEAIASYDKAIDIDPQKTRAYSNKGTVLLALGRYKEAIASFDKALDIDPDYADAYGNKGVALSVLGRYKEEIECYNNVIRINPQDSFAYYNKGIALSELGRKEEEIDCYDKAIDIDPQYVNAYYNKGITLFALGRKKEAIDCFTSVLEYDPQNLKALVGKAYSLIQLNRKVEAKSLIDKILSIDLENKFALEYKKMIES